MASLPWGWDPGVYWFDGSMGYRDWHWQACKQTGMEGFSTDNAAFGFHFLQM